MEVNKGRPTSSSTIYARPPRNTPAFCRHMYKAPVTPPSYWTTYTSDKCVKDWNVNLKDDQAYALVDVDKATFSAVERIIHQTWEPGKLKKGRDARGLDDIQFTRLQVKKVQRLENLTLFEQYGNKRQELFRYASEDPLEKLSDVTGISKGQPATEIHLDATWKNRLFSEVNEMYLFHGTKNVNTQAVCTHGLDTKVGHDKAVYGQALYMAESSTKSDQYTDSKDNRQAAGLQMFLLRACLGKICMLKDCKKLPRPPCQESSCDGMTCDHKRYHSIVSEGKFIFREFVVYDGAQVYPEYLITYDRV